MDKKQAFRIAVQAGKARDFAFMKANKLFKRPKRDKVPYDPFKRSLGLSQVSAEIKRKYNHLCGRSDRRWIARKANKFFVAFYNGNGPQRVYHDTRPSRYAGRG
ncbi:hypothetical protein PA598K_01457 [Paenibacillus sp. 598K]|uniref:hypothetical protein n=1 Tax=Paenibacillus sp. 598K TaxID=1117987 RepID=UPI000FFA1254|nr:hypothetical protein [Paenibacillus sp. 598K]GBF73172.1 hypothetical protein PA598K_01457 [Paenibacillus sp. 598K]